MSSFIEYIYIYICYVMMENVPFDVLQKKAITYLCTAFALQCKFKFGCV